MQYSWRLLFFERMFMETSNVSDCFFLEKIIYILITLFIIKWSNMKSKQKYKSK